jgi:hypothetical protein
MRREVRWVLGALPVDILREIQAVVSILQTEDRPGNRVEIWERKRGENPPPSEPKAQSQSPHLENKMKGECVLGQDLIRECHRPRFGHRS